MPLALVVASMIEMLENLASGRYWIAVGLMSFVATIVLTLTEWEEHWWDDFSVSGIAAMSVLALLLGEGWSYNLFIGLSAFLAVFTCLTGIEKYLKVGRQRINSE